MKVSKCPTTETECEKDIYTAKELEESAPEGVYGVLSDIRAAQPRYLVLKGSYTSRCVLYCGSATTLAVGSPTRGYDPSQKFKLLKDAEVIFEIRI